MQRLCERPGCSEAASVAYGMRAEDLVFWLDVLADTDVAPGGRGVLCRRHADSMVVPRNWTLDDLRDPDLHLFRPPSLQPRRSRPSRRRAAGGDDTGEQLALGVDDDVVDHAVTPVAAGTASAPTSVGASRATPADPVRDDRPDAEPWTPSFDASDDLDGLLAARSPLLARAFRGTDRPTGR